MQGSIKIEAGEKKVADGNYEEEEEENTQKGQRYWGAGEVNREREWDP